MNVPKNITGKWRHSITRRQAICALSAFATSRNPASAQQDPLRGHDRIPSLNELVTAFDFEPVAHAKLPRDAYDYTAQGVESEFTLRRNREAFDWVRIIPRSIAGTADLQTGLDVLGTKMAFPIMLAPTAGHVQLHPQGELASYAGSAAAAGTPMIVSNNASFPIDKIAASAKGTLWFQLYPRQEVEASRELVERAQDAGAKALVITVDQQSSYYERQTHDRHLGQQRRPSARASGADAPPNPYRILDTRLWYDWTFLDQIRPFVKVPVLIKGIVTPEDASLCVKHGVNGIIVSNHGGRSLDYGPSTLEVLPEITAIVAGKIPILVDGGFRRGSDVFKALALGARAVCLGRVPRWALAAYGAQGVQRVLEIVQKELAITMMQAGRTTLASIGRKAVRVDFP